MSSTRKCHTPCASAGITSWYNVSVRASKSTEDCAMKYNTAMLDHQYKAVLFFVQHLAYYRILTADYGGIADHREFWRSTCDAHLKLATVAWCNVFGTYSEELHWMKLPAAGVAQQAQQDFRRRILLKTGLTTDQ